MTAIQADVAARLSRDQIHLYFDPALEPAVRVESGARLVVETEDAHMGSIRSADDIYQSLAEVFVKLGGANPVTGPIYVEGVQPGDCVALTIEEMVPGPVQRQGYTVLTPGLGGLVSNYTLQPALDPRTVICPIENGIVQFPARGRVVEIPCRPFLGTIGIAPAGERRLSYVQGPDFLANTDLPLNGVGATIVVRANVPGARSCRSAMRTPCKARSGRGDRMSGRRNLPRRADSRIRSAVCRVTAGEHAGVHRLDRSLHRRPLQATWSGLPTRTSYIGWCASTALSSARPICSHARRQR